MKLIRAKNVIDFGQWAESVGFTCIEGPGEFGPVHPQYHTANSLHLDFRALDINYYGGGRWDTEQEALTWLYKRVKRFKGNHAGFPLDEMFFNGYGYVKELGLDTNHPISDHEDHLHIGFQVRSW